MNLSHDRDERAARIALTEAAAPQDLPIPPGTSAAELVAAMADLAGSGVQLSKLFTRVLDYDGHRALDEGWKAGARYIIPTDAEWPQALAGLGNHTLLGLWVRGDARLDDATKKAIAMAGSMAASDYGRYAAMHLSGELAQLGYNVIAAASGPGSSIGEAALHGCGASGGNPIGILSGGITGRATPPVQRMRGSILDDGGLLVSSYGPGTLTSLSKTVQRTNLMAALSQAVTLVEGHGPKWEVAARAAERLDRPLLAVPGPITSLLSDLPNELIRQGRARAVLSATNIAARAATRP
ncbi:DNA-processing protein DprA [Streptomyces olivoreticuli]|uniref:DNA-processing protein DprA n=1 Tax=Streptomyces olivoreticuli TaxID=68246 RepID=UPI000E277F17|nr:DNA-processing protein DprA [Streptomyces olivoreticuli]